MRAAAIDLRQRWAMRDERYAGRTLPDARVEAVRWWRAREANEIGASEMVREATSWTPPPGMHR